MRVEAVPWLTNTCFAASAMLPVWATARKVRLEEGAGLAVPEALVGAAGTGRLDVGSVLHDGSSSNSAMRSDSAVTHENKRRSRLFARRIAGPIVRKIIVISATLADYTV